MIQRQKEVIRWRISRPSEIQGNKFSYACTLVIIACEYPESTCDCCFPAMLMVTWSGKNVGDNLIKEVTYGKITLPSCVSPRLADLWNENMDLQ